MELFIGFIVFIFITLFNLLLTLTLVAMHENKTLREIITSTPNTLSKVTETYKDREDYISDYDTLENPDENVMTSYEYEKMIREEGFDNRIALLKEELATSNFPTQREGTGNEAEIGDPLIYNLPHDEVHPGQLSIFDEEVSE